MTGLNPPPTAVERLMGGTCEGKVISGKRSNPRPKPNAPRTATRRPPLKQSIGTPCARVSPRGARWCPTDFREICGASPQCKSRVRVFQVLSRLFLDARGKFLALACRRVHLGRHTVFRVSEGRTLRNSGNRRGRKTSRRVPQLCGTRPKSKPVKFARV